MKEYKLKINGAEYNVAINSVEGSVAKVDVNGTSYEVEMDQPVKKSPAKPVIQRVAAPAAAPTAPAAAAAAPAGGTTITSPLPGVVLDILCKEGDMVKRGQTLLTLEAMKMENSIESTCDGKVVAIKVSKGDSVLEGAQLIVIG